LRKINCRFALCTFIYVILTIGGCQLATLKPPMTAALAPSGPVPPTKILVYDFATSPIDAASNQSILPHTDQSASLNNDQSPAYESRMARDTAEDLSDDLVKRLTKLGFIVQRTNPGSMPPEGAIVINGVFVMIEQGKLRRQLLSGRGSGPAKLDTQVNIDQIVGGAEPIGL
jgi:hypothetical protein